MGDTTIVFEPVDPVEAERVSAMLTAAGIEHSLVNTQSTAFPSFQDQPWGEIRLAVGQAEAAREVLKAYARELEEGEALEDIQQLSGEWPAPVSMPPPAEGSTGRLLLRGLVVALVVAALMWLSDVMNSTP